MFTSTAEHYERNLTKSENTKAAPALIDTPTGGIEPGVIVWGGKGIKVVMPAPHALRLAHEIADALAAHREGK